jgi:hypothetical protein
MEAPVWANWLFKAATETIVGDPVTGQEKIAAGSGGAIAGIAGTARGPGDLAVMAGLDRAIHHFHKKGGCAVNPRDRLKRSLARA